MKAESGNPFGALRAALFILTFSFQLSALADLTATVQPGYTFGGNERADTSKLNRLGRPTVTISGTIGGTNAGIAAGSLNTTMFASSVLGSNLTYDGASPAGIVIKNSGVDTNQIAAGIAGAGLSGGGGTNLAVNTDGATITVTNDILTLGTNLFWLYTTPTNVAAAASYAQTVFGTTGYGTNGPLDLGPGLAISNATLVLTQFVSAEFTLPAGTNVNTAHSLGATPTLLRWVVVCKTNDAGYTVGDELPAESVIDSGNTPNFNPGANTTNVFLVGVNSGFQVHNKTNGNITALTSSGTRWRVKCYARP